MDSRSEINYTYTQFLCSEYFIWLIKPFTK